MADTPFPNWDNYPNLDDVITKADIDTKGGGKFAADYVNHMKVSQLLRKHAPGWQFETRPFVDHDGIEHDCWKAPNGSAYVKGFFRAPTGSGFKDTPDMPQAVMDNRNQSIPFDKVSARDFTDTERRCQCTAAARHFGLAYQLWAKVEIENPHRGDEKPSPAVKPNPPAQQQAKATPANGELQDLRGQVSAAMGKVYETNPKIAADWAAAFKKQFPKHGADQPKIQALNKEQLIFSQEFIYAYE
jgi:hypothetical protein